MNAWCASKMRQSTPHDRATGLPLGEAHDYRACMFGQLDSLQKVFDSLLAPIEDRLERLVPNASARGSDPMW